MRLDRARIVDEALALLNEVGIEALSTRLLAKRLNVRQPAFYWHFKSKRELLDAMGKEMLARGHAGGGPKPGQDWRSFLIDNTRQFRAALLAYRDGGLVHAGIESDPDHIRSAEALLDFLTDAGMDVKAAIDLLAALGSYALGCVIEEQADAPKALDRDIQISETRDYTLVSAALAHYRAGGHAALFEAGLALILDGAAARLAARGG